MANLTSIKAKIDDADVASDEQLDADLFQTIGSSLNYLIDETDDQQSRIYSLQNYVASKDEPVNVAFGVTQLARNSTTTLASNSITPTLSSNILCMLSGLFAVNADSTLRVKRGASTIFSIDIGSDNYTTGSSTWVYQAFSLLNGVDNGATTGSSNTYTFELEISGVGSTIGGYAANPAIQLIEVG